MEIKMNNRLTCQICNEYKADSDDKGKAMNALQGHILTTHKITMKNYIATYGVDIEYVAAMRKRAADASKRRLRDPKVIEKNNQKLLNEIGQFQYNNLPTCEICGFKGKQLYKHISTIHDMDIEEYKTKYSGRLEQDEYLFNLSESRKGSNNPMWQNGSSELSPFAKEFYMKKGFSEADAIDLAKNKIIDNHLNRESSQYTTHIDYYIKKYNCSIEDAQEYYYVRQSTNSVENIAKRNNISFESAQIIRNNITDKWQETLNNKPEEERLEILRKKINGSNSISPASMIFFENLIISADLDKTACMFGLNEFAIGYDDSDKRRHRSYDFTYKNKIIEYNGDRTHANPKIYKANDYPHKHMQYSNDYKTAQEIWDYDEKKGDLAKLNGYEIMYIWHSDVKANPYKMLRLAKEFLESEKI